VKSSYEKDKSNLLILEILVRAVAQLGRASEPAGDTSWRRCCRHPPMVGVRFSLPSIHMQSGNRSVAGELQGI